VKNRRKASVINSTVAIIGQFLSLLFSFVSRTIFIRVLGEQYLGLNGLFTNLLNILSFAELGIGSAIVFSMYRPLSEHDIPQIKALMFLYKRCYHIIALILMFGGAVILIFLPYLIAGKYDVGNIYIAFLLYLLNSVLSYFWSYKRSIFVANQEGYINSFNQLIFNVVMQSIQIIFLVMYKSYYVYLVIQIVFTVLSNWQISKLANKRYPYLKERVTERVEKKTLSYLKRNVIGMISSKIGGVVVFGTDNLLLSGFIGLAAVGKYSNYTLIINGITTVINQGLSAVTASIGNLRITGTKKKQAEIFFQYSQLVNYVAFFISITAALFFPSFIIFWVGKKYMLSPILTYLIIFGFFVSSLRYSNLNFMNAYGTYWEMRYKSLVEAGTNFIISLFLIKYTNLGIAAVVLGTLLSNLLVNSWWEPLIVFRVAIGITFRKYIKFYLVSLISGGGLIALLQFNLDLTRINIVESGLVSITVGLIALLFFHYITVLIAFPKDYNSLRISSIVHLFKR